MMKEVLVKYTLTILVCLLLGLGTLYWNQTQSIIGKLELLSAKIDALTPSTAMSKMSCQTATYYIQTLMTYQKKCN